MSGFIYVSDIDIPYTGLPMFVAFEISVPQLSFSKWKSIESTESVEIFKVTKISILRNL